MASSALCTTSPTVLYSTNSFTYVSAHSITITAIGSIANPSPTTPTPAATLDLYGHRSTSSTSSHSVLAIVLPVTFVSIALIALIAFLLHRYCGAAAARRRNGDGSDNSKSRHFRKNRDIDSGQPKAGAALDDVFGVAQRGDVRQLRDVDCGNLEDIPNPQQEKQEAGPGTLGPMPMSLKADTEDRQNRSRFESAQHRTSNSREERKSFGPLPAQDDVVVKASRVLSMNQPIQRSTSPAIVLFHADHDTRRSTSPGSEAPGGDSTFAPPSPVSLVRPDSFFSVARSDSIYLDPMHGEMYSRAAIPPRDQASAIASSPIRKSVSLSAMPESVRSSSPAPSSPLPPNPLGSYSVKLWSRARSGSSISRPSLSAARPASSGSIRPGSSGSSRRSLSRLGAGTPLGEDGFPLSLNTVLELPAPPHRYPHQYHDPTSLLDMEEGMIEGLENLSLSGSRSMTPVRRSGRFSPATLHGSTRRWFRSWRAITPPPSFPTMRPSLFNSDPSLYRLRSSSTSSSVMAVHGTTSSSAVLAAALATERSQSLNVEADPVPSAQEMMAAAEEMGLESSPDNIELPTLPSIPTNAAKFGNDASVGQDGAESDQDDSVVSKELADESNASGNLELRRRNSYPLALTTVSSPRFAPSALGPAAKFAQPQPHPRTQPTHMMPLPISKDGPHAPSAGPSEADEAQGGARSLGYKNSSAATAAAGFAHPFRFEEEEDDGSHLSHFGELLWKQKMGGLASPHTT
ncbi:unnamed protein product [Tilletia laevis]|uniref:Uncharacterized protein n=1 Tax=Tilletia laevis TaxID=157183 RepID=A0A9N8LMA1_9BASI|nr:unnamed protein product [Tilletia laevis]CAD6910996.1 unnamed protein product [Tilletia laevis]